MKPLIDVQNLSKSYQTKMRGSGFKDLLKDLFCPSYQVHEALRDVTFTLQPGECLAFLGPNGAGKSTLIKTLCGIIRPDSGKIAVLGESPSQRTSAFYRKVGVVFGHKSSLWWDLPLAHSFEMVRISYQIDRKTFQTRLNNICERLDIGRILKRPVRVLSLGERVKGELAINLLFQPDLILLDEPTIGLDIASKSEMRLLLNDLRKNTGLGVFITSHDMGDIEGQADRVLLVNKGEIKFNGSIQKLKESVGDQIKLVIELDPTLFAASQAALIAAAKQLLNESAIAIDAELGHITMNCPKSEELKLLKLCLETSQNIKRISVNLPTLEEVLIRQFQSFRSQK